ncbi:DUF1127 domain-containing protein [Roseovarius sp. MBR-6]|uniref:DUF1127 domain-containing protein n=1 Tax=Roseovarius sp. MBR-6 TaxID=3156459 RepID=UPI003399B50D
MTYSSHTGHSAATSIGVAQIATAPLRAIGFFFRSIIEANRMAREVETMMRLSDETLLDIGLTRDEIIPGVARKYGLRDTI